ncbi:hypothetical protein M5K25_000636 [Dendrobium thyrsiflorum]|uniref:Uncharacterized protein n=1 Tax=Dendrobium thyrsiflorum TaxID=117978 RepID=A0ABD0W5Y6_DENTH
MNLEAKSKLEISKIKSETIRAPISASLQPKAPSEALNHNLSYQTVFKRDVLIVESSSSTEESNEHKITGF